MSKLATIARLTSRFSRPASRAIWSLSATPSFGVPLRTVPIFSSHVFSDSPLRSSGIEPRVGGLQYFTFDHPLSSQSNVLASRLVPVTEWNSDEVVPIPESDTWQASSTLKKRRLKMNRHKYRKRRKRDRRRSKK